MNILLTGGFSGIGFNILKILLDDFKNDHIFLITRKKKKEYYKKNLNRSLLDKNVTFLNYDLSEIQSIKKTISAIEDFKIDVLINNAGAFIEKSKNDEIHDMIILNSLSPYFISTQVLRKNPNAKIINISSFLQKIIKLKDFNNFDPSQINVRRHKVYAMSKFLLNLLSASLKKNFKYAEIICANPGIVSSNFGFQSSSFSRKILSIVRNIFAKSAKDVAVEILTCIKTNELNKLDQTSNNLIFNEKIHQIVMRSFFGKKCKYEISNINK
jgi:short-subunit dehydrogenase